MRSFVVARATCAWIIVWTACDSETPSSQPTPLELSADASVCGEPLTRCGEACVDLTTDPTHCGACDEACAGVCQAGVCVAEVAPGCSNDLVRDLSIRDIAAYQTIKVPLMQAGRALSTADRTAPIVAAKPTVVRVFVDPSPAFEPRAVQARLLTRSGNQQRHRTLTLHIDRPSTDEDAESTFQFLLPPSEITSDAHYAVELVECEPPAAAGAAGTSRWPAEGTAPLAAVETGNLKIVVVPVTANERTPPVTAAALAPYIQALEAMYPIARVEIAVAEPLATAYPIDWLALLDQLRARRAEDQPPSDVYYYGLVRPTDTFEAYCDRRCTAGVGYATNFNEAAARVAVGIAYDHPTAINTMPHELGHNHGLYHAPCPTRGLPGVDAHYPYPGAGVGVWGFDARGNALISPTGRSDIMSYCKPMWISDYTYKRLFDRIMALRTSAYEIVDQTLIAKYRVLLSDKRGARWGTPFRRPDLPFGTAEPAEVLGRNGKRLADVTVYRTAVSHDDASTVLVPEPQVGWHALRIAGAGVVAFE